MFAKVANTCDRPITIETGADGAAEMSMRDDRWDFVNDLVDFAADEAT